MTDMVNGKPLLIYPLNMLLLCGIKNIVMFGLNDLLIEAKEILEDRIQEIDAIKFSYIDSLNSYMGHHVVLIDGNLYLYGINLTRYLQRTIVHKNVISCVACSSEKHLVSIIRFSLLFLFHLLIMRIFFELKIVKIIQ